MVKIDVNKTHTLTGHKDCIYALERGLTPNSFFTAGADGLIVSWDLDMSDQGKLLAKSNNTVYALKIIPELKMMIMGQNFDGIHQIDIENKKIVRSLKLSNTPIFNIEYYDDKLFIVNGFGELIIVDFLTWEVINTVKLSSQNARSIALNKSKDEIAIGYSDNYIRIFNTNDFSLQKAIKAHDNSVFSLSYTPDEQQLMSGGMDARLKVWDANSSYSPTKDIVAHMFTINDIAFTPSAQFFATCSKDKSIKVWQSNIMKLRKVIDKARHAGHGTSVNRILWLDNHTLVSCGDDKIISVWKLEHMDMI